MAIGSGPAVITTAPCHRHEQSPSLARKFEEKTMRLNGMQLAGLVAVAIATPASAQTATRGEDGKVLVRWRDWAGEKPVSVWRAESPYARGKALRLVSSSDRDGQESVAADATSRPYFLIRSAGGKKVWVAERVVQLTGGQNFRDIGGYRTTNGKTVRWGQVFRAASMAGYTHEDQVLLKRLGVTSIIDLRSTSERDGDANPWMAGAGLGYWSRDYALSGGNLAGLMRIDRSTITADMLRAVMTKGYRGFPKEQAPSYREMFARLTGSDAPLALNCTAGKDRTGLGTALILTALGVPYDTVKADFLISNTALDVRKPGADRMLKAIQGALSPEVAAPLIRVEGPYLDAAFDQIKADYGSVEAYLEKELGVSAKALKQLHKRMLV
jgi:protein-tyrosine phosphatase